MKLYIWIMLIAAVVTTRNATAEKTFEVAQLNKEFTLKEMTIKTGDVVKFTNQDPFFHNVFSLSDAAMFDLGSFPKGDSKEVKFEEAGEVEVECAIHPNMTMLIKVED